MTAALESAGLPPDIIPDHPKMVGVVKAAAAEALPAIRRKRAVASAT
jgi:hypothetical protein